MRWLTTIVIQDKVKQVKWQGMSSVTKKKSKWSVGQLKNSFSITVQGPVCRKFWHWRFFGLVEVHFRGGTSQKWKRRLKIGNHHERALVPNFLCPQVISKFAISFKIFLCSCENDVSCTPWMISLHSTPTCSISPPFHSSGSSPKFVRTDFWNASSPPRNQPPKWPTKPAFLRLGISHNLITNYKCLASLFLHRLIVVLANISPNIFPFSFASDPLRMLLKYSHPLSKEEFRFFV